MEPTTYLPQGEGFASFPVETKDPLGHNLGGSFGATTRQKETPKDIQVGGQHYKDLPVQPIDFILKNNLGFIEGNVVKYICRYQSKGGLQDLNKIIHYVELLKEYHYGTK